MKDSRNTAVSRSPVRLAFSKPRRSRWAWATLAVLIILLVPVGLLLATGISTNRAVVFLPRIPILRGQLALGVGLTLFWSLAGLLGYREWEKHTRRLDSIPIRVHVNGSRGKTGTCRLIASALLANGLKVVTKTTGKAPAVIDVLGNELPLREGENEDQSSGNIREQRNVVELAAKQGAQALVVECMALLPELQQVSEEKLIRATVGVITNIRPDHLEIIGPDLETAAKNLCRMIPKNQVLVTCEENMLPTIESEAARRGCRVVKADPHTVPDSLIDEFPYITFKENVAIALKVCQLLGLDQEKSLWGMLQSTPDYGTVRLFQRWGLRGQYLVVMAFGVNDLDSMASVMEELLRRGKIRKGPMLGLFNSRDDRAQRSVEFGKYMAKQMSLESIIVTGEYTRAFVRSAVKAGYPKRRLVDMEGAEPEEVLGTLDNLTPRNGVVIACGNMVTESGYGIVEMLEEGSKAWPSQPLVIQS